MGKITLHLRWKNFKKDCSFPTISRWGRVALHLGRDYTFEQTKLYFQWMIYGAVRNIGVDFECLTGG